MKISPLNNSLLGSLSASVLLLFALNGAALSACPPPEGSLGEATRIFAGPGEYPPESYGAYGIVAFKSAPNVDDPAEVARYLAICEAYRLSIPESTSSTTPLERQLVTVWPIESDEAALGIRLCKPQDRCGFSLSTYGLRTSLQAIRDARMISGDLREELAEREGPFLLAWNPAFEKGSTDALILRMDLSSVENYSQAKNRFELWVQEIETNPEIWVNDWHHPKVVKLVGELADKYGTAFVSLFLGQ